MVDATWLAGAIQTVDEGIADKMVDGKTAVYRVGDITRVDMRAEDAAALVGENWLTMAMHAVQQGVADKLIKENVAVYRIKNIIRVDIKPEK